MNRLDHDEVRLRIQAVPELLYDLASDVPRTPEWSPEVTSCRWLDGATGAMPGARFSARNKRRWFTWSNKPVVETAERGREFAFTRTEPGGGTIRWFYRFEPGSDGTTAELGYQVLSPVPVLLHLILRALFGVRDLRADLHQNMTISLQKLAGSPNARPSRHTPPAATEASVGLAAEVRQDLCRSCRRSPARGPASAIGPGGKASGWASVICCGNRFGQTSLSA
jgi:Polyketide cyclase / dehydrase and lipid transport